MFHAGGQSKAAAFSKFGKMQTYPNTVKVFLVGERIWWLTFPDVASKHLVYVVAGLVVHR